MRDNTPSVAPTGIYLKLICVALFWGGTFIAGRIIIQAIPPMTAATARFIVAVALLLFLCWRTSGGLPKLSRQQMFSTFLLGVTGIFAYNVCFFSALHHMPAGRTALFVALNPVVTALMLASLFGERLGLVKWLGIAIAFSGAAIVITHGELMATLHDISHSIGRGELFMMGAVLCWASYTIIGRKVLTSLSPLVATTYASIWGLGMLAVGALTEIASVDFSHFTYDVNLSILYHGALGTVVAFVWYYEGVKAIGPSRSAIFNNLVPVFGVTLSVLLLREAITLSMVVGGLITLGGVLLTSGLLSGFRRKSPAATALPPEG